MLDIQEISKTRQRGESLILSAAYGTEEEEREGGRTWGNMGASFITAAAAAAAAGLDQRFSARTPTDVRPIATGSLLFLPLSALPRRAYFYSQGKKNLPHLQTPPPEKWGPDDSHRTPKHVGQ